MGNSKPKVDTAEDEELKNFDEPGRNRNAPILKAKYTLVWFYSLIFFTYQFIF